MYIIYTRIFHACRYTRPLRWFFFFLPFLISSLPSVLRKIRIEYTSRVRARWFDDERWRGENYQKRNNFLLCSSFCNVLSIYIKDRKERYKFPSNFQNFFLRISNDESSNRARHRPGYAFNRNYRKRRTYVHEGSHLIYPRVKSFEKFVSLLLNSRTYRIVHASQYNGSFVFSFFFFFFFYFKSP